MARDLPEERRQPGFDDPGARWRDPGTNDPDRGGNPDLNPPRWSPDGRWIAFFLWKAGWKYELFVTDVATRTTRLLKQVTNIKGITWLPDGDGVVFASAAGSTMVYPPIFNLFSVSPDGSRERQLTVGDVSYEQPDIVTNGQLFAVRTLMKSDVWRFPVAGAAVDNARNATHITRQTGQVQTPSVSPDGREIAHLSDTGGHSNVWIARTDGAEPPRPLTSEVDVRVIVRWLYYQDQSEAQACVYKTHVFGDSPPVRVRCDAAVPAPASDGTLYFVPRGFWNANEIYKAKPENADRVLVTRYAVSRVPLWPTGFALSPDERWLAVPLKDNGTTNIWAIPTDGGPYRQITDFGRRPTLIGRQVSWSRDGRFIYAAVTESDADIVLFDGIDTRR